MENRPTKLLIIQFESPGAKRISTNEHPSWRAKKPLVTKRGQIGFREIRLFRK